MPLRIEDHGTGNAVMILPALLQQLNGRIELRGDGNSVTIGAPAQSHELAIGLGSRSNVAIGPHCLLGHLLIHTEDSAEVVIGPASAFNGAVRFLLHEPGRISLGEFCLFGGDVDVTISDMHSILDAASGARLNPARDVTLGDRVWVGQRSMILKGVTIGHDAIIGAGAVVTRSVPAHCIAAGNPARVVRRGVRWRPELL
jgi:acetyltransferase-like isoleucine patch superfamily enzyme